MEFPIVSFLYLLPIDVLPNHVFAFVARGGDAVHNTVSIPVALQYHWLRMSQASTTREPVACTFLNPTTTNYRDLAPEPGPQNPDGNSAGVNQVKIPKLCS